MTFWISRGSRKMASLPLKAWKSISMMIDRQSKMVSTNLAVEQADQLKRNMFNAQVMFTNLGRLPFDRPSALYNSQTSGRHVLYVASTESRPLEPSQSTDHYISRTPAPNLFPACLRA